MKGNEILTDQELILELHEFGCIRFGHFRLVSGKESPIYIDLRLLVSKPFLLRHVARTYARLLEPLQFDRLAAVPYAALPIGTAVALELGRPLVYARKFPPAPGIAPAIESVFSSGDRIAIIEDLVTKGGSALKAARRLEAAGLVVNDVVVLLDRQEGARERLATGGYVLHAAFTLSDVLHTLASAGRVSKETADAVLSDHNE